MGAKALAAPTNEARVQTDSFTILIDFLLTVECSQCKKYVLFSLVLAGASSKERRRIALLLVLLSLASEPSMCTKHLSRLTPKH